MNHKRLKMLKVTLLIMLGVASVLQSTTLIIGQQAQNPKLPEVGVITIGPAEPANPGKPDGEDLKFKPNKGAPLKTYLYSQTLPKIWLAFKNSSISKAKVETIKVQLPPEAKQALTAYWEVARDHAYYEKFADKRDVQKSINMDRKLAHSHDETVRRLQQVLIDAPDGRRAVSYEEANDLVIFAHLVAIRLIDRAKEYQKKIRSDAVARRLTTHSTGAESACLSSDNLKAWFGVPRPVNSGVRCSLLKST